MKCPICGNMITAVCEDDYLKELSKNNKLREENKKIGYFWTNKWARQQEEIDLLNTTIDHLKNTNEKLRGCIDYYASDTNWVGESEMCNTTGAICLSDVENLKGHYYELEGFENCSSGGKRARQCLKEIDNKQRGK